jgi:anti-sigma B factor antagonist
VPGGGACPSNGRNVVDFSITTRRLPGGVVEISPRGEVDMEHARELQDAIDAAFADASPDGHDHQITMIKIDLWWVPFIDSVAISSLVRGYHTAAIRGVRLIVTNPTDFVYRQLYISGLVGLFGAPRPRTPAHEHDEAEPVA